jgi:hypothetical protein
MNVKNVARMVCLGELLAEPEGWWAGSGVDGAPVAGTAG